MSPPAKGPDRVVDVLIEIPRGSRSKYEFDSKSGRLRLHSVLSSSVHYPTDYGFILETLGRDGDELDVLLLTEEPAYPGSVQAARPIGVLDMADRKGEDQKILAVPASDARFAEYRQLADLPDHWKLEIKTFFHTYRQLDGKNPEVRGWRGAPTAWRLIESAQRAYRKRPSK
ncbi:MAG TPA: inorganic diphosphatase [Candidatus Dormibacteraeota bacterium]|jgi:inorganic pyrophosphatase